MIGWLVTRWQWPAAALFGGIALLSVAPVFFQASGLLLGLVYLQLPIYMIHQFEEHHQDRFRTFVNTKVFGGVEALTPMTTFLINLVFVWVLDLISLSLAAFVDIGWGTIACDIAIFNGITHTMVGIVRREYNPGLITALLLFFPVGGFTLYELSTTGGATVVQQITGAAIAVLLHVAIIVIALRQRARLTAQIAGFRT
jgi:hypothetical protein